LDFTLSEEQSALQAAAREYAQRRLPAIAQDIETTGEPPSHSLIAEFASHGFLGINIPEDLGGLAPKANARLAAALVRVSLDDDVRQQVANR